MHNLIERKMITEVNEAQKFLISKYGSAEKVPVGTHAIPTKTSKGKAFMAVTIDAKMNMSGFALFLDEELTQPWKP